MAALVVLLLSVVANLYLCEGASNHLLVATPEEIIPGLTPTLSLQCGAGNLVSQYREIFFIQILNDVGGTQTPLATLLPDQAPSLSVSGDSRLTVSGQLLDGAPDTASLQVSVNSPTALDAGQKVCKVVGLGNSGNEVSNTETVAVTVHPESDVVDDTLKDLVSSLKREADALQVQTQVLQQENQRLSQLTTTKQQALLQKKADLQQLRTQMQTLQQTVDARELTLNQTADQLVEEIANVTRDAPPMRVSFNAVERTERTYASGAQIQFETVEMNDGSGYNSTSSVFHPPVAGVYYFTTAQLAHDTAAASYRAYSIRVNSTVVGSAYNSDDRQSSTYMHSSTGTVVSLTPYDLVTVYQQYASTSTTSLGPYSNTPNGLSTNFAGYLVY